MRLLLAKKCSASHQGFTLIELLMVLMIMGILGAVALPNFLNQSVKAQQSEAKQVMKTVNQAQTMYRAQNSQFTDNFDTLASGIVRSTAGIPNTAQTNVFTYTISTADGDKATLLGQAKDSAAKSYTGGVWRYLSNSNEAAFVADFCESDSNNTTATEVTITNNQIQCPGQFHPISESR